MFQAEDEATLRRMLGEQELPESLESEYEVRLRMFHSAGHSGPLGAVALIDLARTMGLNPPFVKREAEKVDWQKQKQGSTRVEAKFFGEWMPGTFHGFGDYGILLVRLDDDKWMKECRPDMVRLAKYDTVSYDDAPNPNWVAEQESKEPEDDISEVLQDAREARTGIDWSLVDAGEEVWVPIDDDIVTAKFVAYENTDDGVVLKAQVDDKVHEFDPDEVTYAGTGHESSS